MKFKKITALIVTFIITALCFVGCTSKPQSYTVTFETNGGTAVKNVVSDVVTFMPVPAKKDFYFVNWYTKPDFSSNPVIFPFYPKQDTTLYAKFNEGVFKYKINEDNTSVTITGTNNCPLNTELIYPSNLTINNTVYPVTNIDIKIENDEIKNVKNISFEKDFNINNLLIMYDKVTKVDFSNLTSLKNIQLISNDNLQEIIYPNNITEIPSHFMVGDNKITNLIIPSSINTINNNAFRGLNNVTKITFNNSNLTTIKSEAFDTFFKLKEVNLPSSVTSIEKDAFKDCFNLEKVVINSNTVITLGYISNSDKTKIYVKNKLLNEYKLKYKNLTFVGF